MVFLATTPCVMGRSIANAGGVALFKRKAVADIHFAKGICLTCTPLLAGDMAAFHDVVALRFHGSVILSLSASASVAPSVCAVNVSMPYVW